MSDNMNLPLAEAMKRAQAMGEADVYRPSPSLRPEPANSAGSFVVKKFNLATDASDPFGSDSGESVPIEGYSLRYMRDGSSSFGRVQVSFGGDWVTLAPGDKIDGYFSKFQIRNWRPRTYNTNGGIDPVSTGGFLNAQGEARVVIIQNPNLSLLESPNKPVAPSIYGYGTFENPSNGGSESLGAFRRIGSIQDTAATTNVPSVATDGFNLDGTTAVRVLVATEFGSTITSGQLRIWFGLALSGGTNWYLNQGVSYDIQVAGQRRVVFPDIPIIFPWGRMFVECNNFVVTAGAADLAVDVLAWGLT